MKEKKFEVIGCSNHGTTTISTALATPPEKTVLTIEDPYRELRGEEIMAYKNIEFERIYGKDKRGSNFTPKKKKRK